MKLGVICHGNNGIEILMFIKLGEERVELEENLNFVTLRLSPELFVSLENVICHLKKYKPSLLYCKDVI